MSDALTPISRTPHVPMAAAATPPAAKPEAVPSGLSRDRLVRVAGEAMADPLHWAGNQMVRLTAPLGVDGRYAAGGLMAGKVLAFSTKAGSMGYHFVRISRTEGLRAFASRVGARGVAREAGQAFGRGWVRALGVTGVCVAGGIAAGFVAYRLQDHPGQP